MRPRPAPLALSCAVLFLTGCGGSNLLDGSSASELQDSLTTVRTAISDGRCDEARSAARDGAERVGALPTSVDAELRKSLEQGFDELATLVRTDCEPPTTTTEATPTTTEVVPPPTETPVEPQTTTESAPETTTEETTPEEPAPDGGLQPEPEDDEVVPDDSGGVTPGVDGPGATERSVRKRLEKLRKQFEKSRGKGNG